MSEEWGEGEQRGALGNGAGGGAADRDRPTAFGEDGGDLVVEERGAEPGAEVRK